jgi:AAA family ATP:ADP antiporter
VSRGLGGFIILLATSVLSLSVSQLSLAVVALVLPWIAIVLELRRAYVETLRESLARRDIGDLSSALRDPGSLAVFHHVLEGTDDKEILYALELVRGTDDETILADATRLASHESPDVRTAAIRALRGASEPPTLDDMERRVHDENVGAGAEALALWLRVEPESARKAFASLVQLADVERLGALLDCLQGSEALLPPDILGEIVFRHCGSEDPACRKLAAKAIGFLPEGAVAERQALELLQDPDMEVARPAATSAGKLRLESAFTGLIQALGRPALRAHARRAIARYGDPALDEIERLLLDEAQPATVRRALPRAVAEFEDQRSVQALFASLPSDDGPFHYQAVKSLARLRARAPSLRFSRSDVDRVLGYERETLLELSGVLAGLATTPPTEPSERLLVAVLGERVDFTRERIFRLLGLLYPQNEITALWSRIVSGPPAVRAAALEYLSNLLSRRHGASLFGILETGSQPDALRRGVTLEGDPAPTHEEALARLLQSTDEWVLACTVTVVGVLGLRSLFPRLDALRDHRGAVVREAAEHALRSPGDRVSSTATARRDGPSPP